MFLNSGSPSKISCFFTRYESPKFPTPFLSLPHAYRACVHGQLRGNRNSVSWHFPNSPSLSLASCPAVTRISRPPVEIRRSVRPAWTSPLSHRRRRHYDPHYRTSWHVDCADCGPIFPRRDNVCSGPMLRRPPTKPLIGPGLSSEEPYSR